MPLIEIVAAPPDLRVGHGAGHVIVVIDQLRATTTIAAALAAGVLRIHAYASIPAAREAYATLANPTDILMGEAGALAPEGFGLGNSPRPFLDDPARYAGRSAFMVTTNGTPALMAAADHNPEVLLTAALINRRAVAKVIAERFNGRDVTILCAGLHRAFAADDVLAAGSLTAALSELTPDYTPSGDLAQAGLALFRDAIQNDGLEAALRRHQGGRNIIALGLSADITAAARLDLLDVVPVFDGRLISAWDNHTPLAQGLPR
jgi:2-phosphosulfolactate phosphatase